jgi:tripartite ATP-independent transporter DctM subunit
VKAATRLGGQVSDVILRAAAIVALSMLALVPLIDMILVRFFWFGLPGAIKISEQGLLALTFLSAAMTTRDGHHLSLTTGPRGPQPVAMALRSYASLVTSAVPAAMFWASMSLVVNGFEPGVTLLGMPIQVFVAVMPLGFLLIVGYTVRGTTGWERMAAVAGAVVGTWLGAPAIIAFLQHFHIDSPGLLTAMAMAAQTMTYTLTWPLCIGIGLAAFAGAPLYVALGGIALVLMLAAGSQIELLPSEAYNLLKGTAVAAIPLFTLVGILLSESGSGKRLVAVFRELFGWIPGGEAIAAILVCTFFTTFTGANGVTILALGGILSYILIESGSNTESFSHGLLTSSASLGLLFPPSIAVILYTVNAQFQTQSGAGFDVTQMFLGSLIPGFLFVVAMCAVGVITALRHGHRARAFDVRAASVSLKPAALELLVPVIIALLYFSGTASLTEIGGVTLLYLVIVEVWIKRELKASELFKVLERGLSVVGGALIILVVARGLSFFIIDSGLPERFTTWITETVHSRLVFLALLNVGLLVVGCLMDIFSAVLVVSPLVIPLGAVFGIHPVHLAVIFIANLSIGFLTPPVGMNLFLASYAFKKPVLRIYRDVVPFLAIQLVILAIITYVPWFSTALLGE